MNDILISILIPTRNRSDFLKRLLQYYSDLHFCHKIYIGDSSSSDHVEQTKNTINALKAKLKIFYYEYAGLNNAQAISNLLDSVSTPYAVLLPDDDFLVPRSLEQCAGFLESHSEYSAAHGLAALFKLKSSGAYGPFLWAGRYWQRPIEGESGAKRLLDHMGNYSVTLFSVHRTEAMRVMYKYVSMAKDKSFALELLPCCLSVIQGKVKELDCLYLVRQDHERRYLLPDVYDWVTSHDWLPSYETFRDCLTVELTRQDGISVDEAREVVKQAFWLYLAKGLTHKWQVRYVTDGPGFPRLLRDLARRVPGLRPMWHKFRSVAVGERHEMSLSALLHPSSPHHGDFMPIYRTITTPLG